jgi:hypothetical protein
VAKDYFERTGLFPIMHVIGVRRTLADRHPWLPGTVLKAFEKAKEASLRALSDTPAPKVTLPFIEERLKDARVLMGEDFWPYGVDSNRKVLDYFLDQHHRKGFPNTACRSTSSSTGRHTKALSFELKPLCSYWATVCLRSQSPFHHGHLAVLGKLRIRTLTFGSTG